MYNHIFSQIFKSMISIFIRQCRYAVTIESFVFHQVVITAFTLIETGRACNPYIVEKILTKERARFQSPPTFSLVEMKTAFSKAIPECKFLKNLVCIVMIFNLGLTLLRKSRTIRAIANVELSF